MFNQRESNPHFHPRVQRYAQPPSDDGLNQPPQRFRPSPPPLMIPPGPPSQPPMVNQPPPTSHQDLDFHPSPPPSLRVPLRPPSQPPRVKPSPPTTHHGLDLHLPISSPAPARVPLRRPHRSSHSPLMVPPPRKTKRLTWLMAICCVLFWIIIILGGLILLIIYLAYRPRYPKFDIETASLNAAYLDLGYLLNNDMTLLANFTNPNKRVDVGFHYVVVNLYFEGALIASQYVHPLAVERRGYELRDVHMVSSQVKFSRTRVRDFTQQIATGRVMFEVKSLLRTTSNLGGFLRYSYWLYGHCKFVVGPPPSGVLIAKKCVTKR